MATGTVRLHRVLTAPPEKVYRAFVDPEAMTKWLPPHGFTARMHSHEAKVGGKYKMSFTNFTMKQGHSFGGEYVELVPGKLVRYTNKFDDPNLSGVMQTRIELKAVFCGTDMQVVQEGIPEAIPVEGCYLGWQQSLMQLALLVEPDIQQ